MLVFTALFGGVFPVAVWAVVLDRKQSPTIGLLGTTRVNVLELNLALDRITP